MFVDRAQVTFQAGDGGNGVTSFRHDKFKHRGGPDGGDGGDGGDIILMASRNQNTLADFRYKKTVKAEGGESGRKSKKHGKSANDMKVLVPVGTAVMGMNGETISDLTTDGQITIIAQGGKGGFGNAHFVSSTRQAPRIAEKGEKGEVVETVLELKMIADVGIVGLPNAGKSTLLSVISNAKPEIASYPFTTLRPNLGVVDIDKRTSLLFADIPGLIEGASEGKGLGDEFLRHVERTSVLVHLIDSYSEELEGDYKTIVNELKSYKIDLSERPRVVALTKIEGKESRELESKIKTLKKLTPRGTQVLSISSPSSQGIPELLRVVEKRVEAAQKAQSRKKSKPSIPVITLKQTEDSWYVEKSKEGFVITGKKIERFARRTDFDDYHGRQRLRDIMKKMGIIRELERYKIEPEQKIAIGSPEIGTIEY
ncbi:GTPase ObgE [Candidatus Saccharibacteria bacterium]|nr:GTPase ObgE [Candidatus Saccharibacteria bacterium]